MAHMISYKRQAAIGILRHDERCHGDKVVARKNEKIDPARTKFNYNLAPQRHGSFKEHLEYLERSGIKVSKRKDLNVMTSWVITLPQNVPHYEHERFFRSVYDFLSKRYGADTVLSATVHLDETTPHMHFCFVPVAAKENGERTVSSKIVCSRADLRSFHKDLSQHMEQNLGYYCEIENGATLAGNQAIEDLKRKTAQAELQQVREDCGSQARLLKATSAAFKAAIDDLPLLSEAKGIFGEKRVKVPESQYELLVKAARTGSEKFSGAVLAYDMGNNLLEAAESIQEHLQKKSEELKVQSFAKASIESELYDLQMEYDKQSQVLAVTKKALAQEKKSKNQALTEIGSLKTALAEGKEKSIEEVTEYKNRLNEIFCGLDSGVCVDAYAKQCFNSKQMKQIRKGLESGVDVSVYAKPEFDWQQMREIRVRMEYGLDVTVEILKPVTLADRLAMARREADERNRSRSHPKDKDWDRDDGFER